MPFNPKTYLTPAKPIGVVYRCKACKRTVRATYDVEKRSDDNGHPEHYLRKAYHYQRIVGDRWRESRYFAFPSVSCPVCAALLYGKAIDGRYNPSHPCDARCTGATGHNCECSCGGANHGMDHQQSALPLFT